MLRGLTVASLLAFLAAAPLSAQETVSRGDNPIGPLPETVSADDDVAPPDVPAWDTVWGLVGLRGIPAGPKTAPNGLEYHPNFSLDLNLNLWIWRSQGLYLFSDCRLWGENGEFGVTNGRDGAVGTSKREFDLDGGVAWNYVGPWELRAFGYTENNLNRGDNRLTPAGFTDGFGVENRYYLSSEYSRLGQTGFDVTRATFLSIGYLPTKNLVGNNGDQFSPGLTLRAYLTYNLWDWPLYLFGDAQYIAEKSFHPRLLIFDLGLAARPFRRFPQWEFRAGAENTADFRAHDVQNLWYVALRFIF
jgi:hypothetical protein